MTGKRSLEAIGQKLSNDRVEPKLCFGETRSIRHEGRILLKNSGLIAGQVADSIRPVGRDWL